MTWKVKCINKFMFNILFINVFSHKWVYNMHIVLDKKLNSDLFKNDNTE